MIIISSKTYSIHFLLTLYKIVFIFVSSKEIIYLCLSILHEQTTAKARSKLVG